MRIVCPQCDTEYNIADTAIQRAGRELQCSNCDKIWFQSNSDHLPTHTENIARSEESESGDSGEVKDIDDQSAEQVPSVSKEISDILRSEAAFSSEIAQREADPQNADSHSQTSSEDEDGISEVNALDDTSDPQRTQPRPGGQGGIKGQLKKIPHALDGTVQHALIGIVAMIILLIALYVLRPQLVAVFPAAAVILDPYAAFINSLGLTIGRFITSAS